MTFEEQKRKRKRINNEIYRCGETLTSIARKFETTQCNLSKGITNWLNKDNGVPRGKLGKAIFFTEELTGITITPEIRE